MPDVDTIAAFLDEEHLELVERLADLAADEIVPLGRPEDDDAARSRARDLLELLGRRGLYEAIGRQEVRSCALIREALAAAAPLADAVFALQALGATPILLADNDAMADRWLTAALRGEAMAAFAMTERDAGSDVASMSTRAVRDGDDWVLDGVKTLISNAGIADFYAVFASTDPDRGSRGISCFVVPGDAPGLEFLGPQVMSAPHPLGEIALEGCRVPATALLGEPGEGFKLGMRTLDRLRPTVAAAACGMAERALDEAIAHAGSREQFGSPLAEFQIVQQKLARMAIDLAAARLLTYRAAWRADGGAVRITLESAMAKAHATEAAQRVVDEAVQIVGGRGMLAEHPVELLYRSVRALRIYEGTTEIQHLIIARHLLDDGGRR